MFKCSNVQMFKCSNLIKLFELFNFFELIGAMLPMSPTQTDNGNLRVFCALQTNLC